MKNQALFSSKDKSRKLKCHLLQFLFGTLRVNCFNDKQTTVKKVDDILIRTQTFSQSYTCHYSTVIPCNLTVTLLVHLILVSLVGPDKIDENLPSYPGFEKDVFRVVKDYFCGLSTPLMTFEMYEVITNIFGMYSSFL